VPARLALLPLLLLSACALPADTGLRDWARAASLAADQPGSDPVAAQRQALAFHLQALGVLAEGAPLRFPDAAWPGLAARAGAADPEAAAAVASLGAVLAAARDANPLPPDQVYSAGADLVPPDDRLRRTLRAGDAPVQALVAAIGRGLGDPAADDTAQAAERRSLAAIAATHATLAGRGRHVTQYSQGRDLRFAEDALRSAALLRPPAAPGATTLAAASVRP
jgi:hypothetical protein